MTISEAREKFYRFSHEHDGYAPTRWFISHRAWRDFLWEEKDALTFYVHLCPADRSNAQLMGLPVYQVIEDGIFECH